MADTKISGLPASATPLVGTEVLPIVQSGSTRQVSVANLTAGRTQTSNGIVQGTAGTGYNFTANTPAAGMTSQLLNWYEEGTWTPTLEANDINFTSVTYDPGVYGRYTRIGKVVHIQGYMRTDAVTIGSAATYVLIGGLPFTPANSSTIAVGEVENWNTNNPCALRVRFGVNSMFLWFRTTANGSTNLLTPSSVATGADSNIIQFGGTYICQ